MTSASEDTVLIDRSLMWLEVDRLTGVRYQYADKRWRAYRLA